MGLQLNSMGIPEGSIFRPHGIGLVTKEREFVTRIFQNVGSSRGETEKKLNFRFSKGVILVKPTDDRRS